MPRYLYENTLSRASPFTYIVCSTVFEIFSGDEQGLTFSRIKCQLVRG